MKDLSVEDGVVMGMTGISTRTLSSRQSRAREEWAQKFTCLVHGQRTYATVMTTKCCAEVLDNGHFCNRLLVRGFSR